MRVTAILFALFLLVPLVELYLLIEVGARIGAPATIAIVIATAVGGAVLLRQQGFATLRRAQNSLRRRQLPAVELVEAVLLLITGLLLLTPGFMTDAIGTALLVPPLRKALAALILQRVVRNMNATPPPGAGPRTIETDYWHEDPDDHPH